MITADEARRIARGNGLCELLIYLADNDIRGAAESGKTSVDVVFIIETVYDERDYSREVLSAADHVLTSLSQSGYSVIQVTYHHRDAINTLFRVSW